MSVVYDTYRFKDKDPIIDAIRTLREDLKISWTELSERTKVSPTTYYNWDMGSTRRPQAATLIATAVALGVDSIDISAAARGKIVLVTSIRRRKAA